MATILEKKKKDGSIAYKIQVRVKDKGTGNMYTRATTWMPDPSKGMRTNERELKEFAVEYEKKIREEFSMDYTSREDITVEKMSKLWLEHIKKTKSPTYYGSCPYYVNIVNENLGKYKLKELNPPIIQKFINKIESAERTMVDVRAKDTLIATREKLKLSKCELSRQSGVCTYTIRQAENGDNIELDTAERISKTLGYNTQDMFEVKVYKEAYAPATKAKAYRTLRSMLSYAVKLQYIDRNYATGEFIDPIQEVNKEKVFLDDTEIKEMLIKLEEYPNIRAKTAIMILIFTGLRRGELCGLTWDDINLNDGIIKIERAVKTATGQGLIIGSTKTKNSNRVIALPQILIKQLIKYKEWWDSYIATQKIDMTDNKYLFIQTNGNVMRPETIGFWLNKMLEEFNMKHVTVHSLRHSNITIQLAAGVPIKTVSARAGHSSTKVTADIYAHMITSSDKEAANILDRLLG